MHTTRLLWEQHANPRMCVRHDGRYWVIAEQTTWEDADAREYAARMYYGTFPMRLQEVGFAWGDTIEMALSNAIEILERHLPAIEARLGKDGANAANPLATGHHPSPAIRSKFAEEWRL